ncbi:MAG TPA: ROK family glucokinase [Mycobacteriales bacterium]|nr:ROK family glucokinase [Mycobacteriales bacterium]
MSGLSIGIDIGGTKIAAGVVDVSGNILSSTRRPTPSQDPAMVEALVAEAIGELRAGYDVTSVGIGAAGWVDASRKTVLFAPNLAWRNTPLYDDLARLVDIPVIVENDANAAAWGEYRFGAGEQDPDTVVLTIGTGIGCGLIIDGKLRRGRFGIGGEPGHMRVVPGGRQCGCGNLGCLEQYCSGTALVRAAREVAQTRPTDAARLLELAGGRAESIDGPVVTQAAQEGDPAAIDCFEEIGRWLGQGMADIAVTLDPGRFVIGGGVVDAGELLLRPARENYAAVLSGRGYRPFAEVVPARLGPDAGMIGAADLARTA